MQVNSSVYDMSKIENYYAASGCYDAGWNKESGAAEKTDDKKGMSVGLGKDQVEISEEGKKVSVRNKEIADKLESVIWDEDFLSQVKAISEKNSNKLIVNWEEAVDPGGKNYAAAFVESILKQYQSAENTIKEYYAEAHKDNLSKPSLMAANNYLVLKYTELGKESGSPYYRADMSEEERRMAYRQEYALLNGGRVILGDPYALASVGGTLNIEDVDRIARQEASDKINRLIQERKESLA